MNRRRFAVWGSAVVAALTIAGGAAGLAQSVAQVPSRERVSPSITYYTPVTPQVATAGLLQGGALAELKSLGFAMVVDLRGPEEGTALEQRAAAIVGLRYINIPVTTEIPSDAQIVEFARLVENAGNYPVIVHCASANRVGAMWTLYRVARGVPVATAIGEGRTIGLSTRESAVRQRLARPPFSN
jgi:uncharacterized protein (TIGR01244 family)